MISMPRLTLEALIEQRDQRDRLSPHTIEQYHLSRRRLEEHLGRTAYVDDLCKARFDEFKETRLVRPVGRRGQTATAGRPCGQTVAPATVNKDLRHLVALERYAYDEELLQDAPRRVRKIRTPRRLAEAWTIAEIELQLAECGRLTGTIGRLGIPRSLFWTGLLLTLYDTGGRIGAVMKSACVAYDAQTRLLFLRCEVQKTSADQAVELSEEAAYCVEWLADWQYAKLFPWPWDADGKWRTLRRHYRRILRAVGLPVTRKDMFHKMRRVNGTQVCAAAGIAKAREGLGHSHESVTRGYVDRRQVPQFQAVSVLPRPKVGKLPERQYRLF